MAFKVTRTLPAQKVNPGIRAAYRRELDALVREMGREAVDAVLAEYDRLEWRIAPDAMAEDAKWRSPAVVLKEETDKLLAAWEKRFGNDGSAAAKKALKDIWRRIRLLRKRTLKEAGITVKIEPSRLTDERFQALLLANEQLIRTIPQQFFASMQSTISNAITSGLDRKAMAEQLYAQFSPPSDKGWSESRWFKHCRFIARDQTSKAVQALAECTDRDLGLTEGIWVHNPGRLSSRLTHIQMGRDKKPFKLTEGKFDPAEGRKVKPGELYNCLPGNAKLHGFSFIEKCYRHWYFGELTCLTTDNGAILETTPNHPVLTPFGWKSAHLLNVGDYIVQTDPESCHIFKREENECVPTIQEIFDAFSLRSEYAGIFSGSHSQFHGDGSDSKVDIISIDRLLMDEGNSLFFEAANKFDFSRSDYFVILDALSSIGNSLPVFKGFLSTPSGGVGGFCERLSKLLCCLTEPERCSLLAAAYMHSGLQEPASDSRAGTPEFFSNGFFCHAGLIKGYDFLIRNIQKHRGTAPIAWNNPREFFNSLGNDVRVIPYFSGNVLQVPPRGYLFGRITDKVVRNFSGHVYNLQTRSGSFIAQNTVVHNCMCSYRPIIPDTWRA